ncbi:MAG: hypothetical protein U1E28_08520 [Beijerinckiaceae bacterium]
MIAHDVTLDELKADTLSCIMLFYRQKRGMSLECWVREHLEDAGYEFEDSTPGAVEAFIDACDDAYRDVCIKIAQLKRR